LIIGISHSAEGNLYFKKIIARVLLQQYQLKDYTMSHSTNFSTMRKTTPHHAWLRRVHLMVLFSLLAIILIACASKTGSSSSSSTTNNAANSVNTANQDKIPGKDEFGMSSEELYASIENVESEISKCMNDAGFEYIAVDFNTVRRGMTADKSLAGMSERQFIDQYGFGISTLYSGLAPQLSELPTAAQIGLGAQNVQTFRNLSPADQVAYSHTLFGEHPDATFSVALETEDFTRTGGCTRSAIEKFFTPEQLNSTYINPFDALVDQDPRMVKANVEFANCLRSAGFDYSHEKEIEPDLRSKLDAITDGLPLEALSSDAQAALKELQDYERALASITVSCESRYLDPVADQVERELYAGPQQ
jgi:hypothetical protein